jgi:hypothetical protein
MTLASDRSTQEQKLQAERIRDAVQHVLALAPPQRVHLLV